MLYLGVRCYASLVGDRQYNASNQKTDPLLLDFKGSSSNIKNPGTALFVSGGSVEIRWKKTISGGTS
jgi:hypothetical protein